jgi:hypothetical protein
VHELEIGMKGQRIFITLAAGGLLLTAAHAVPPNSYLVKTVSTTSDMIKQIKSNPVVSSRYERHFHMTQGDVIEMVKGLRFTKTDQTGFYSVYNVPAKTGELRSKLLKLKKGIKIWVDSSGQPILQWICGNPMVRGGAGVADVAPVVAGLPSEPITMADPMPSGDVPVIASTLQPGIPDAPLEETVVVIDEVPVQRRNNALAGLLLLPLLAVNRTSTKTPEVVPEPATMLAMGAGISYVMARRRKKS